MPWLSSDVSTRGQTVIDEFDRSRIWLYIDFKVFEQNLIKYNTFLFFIWMTIVRTVECFWLPRLWFTIFEIKMYKTVSFSKKCWVFWTQTESLSEFNPEMFLALLPQYQGSFSLCNTFYYCNFNFKLSSWQTYLEVCPMCFHCFFSTSEKRQKQRNLSISKAVPSNYARKLEFDFVFIS